MCKKLRSLFGRIAATVYNSRFVLLTYSDDDDDSTPVWPTRVVGVLSGVRVVETYTSGLSS
jgi:hypothetical protein